MLKRWLRAAAATIALALHVIAGPGAHAASLSISDYRQDAWGAKEGAPQFNMAIVQARDGWLWVGAFDGLYRFDGVQFERFVPAPGESLNYSAISALSSAPNGDLLIGYLSGGLSVLRNGHLIHLTSVERHQFANTFAVLADSDGTYWVAALDGLMHFDGRNWEKIGLQWGYPGTRTDNLALDRYGRLFVSDGKTLYLLDRSRRRFLPTGIVNTSLDIDLTFDASGELWNAAGSRLTSLQLPATDLAVVRAVDRYSSQVMNRLFDRDGNLWVKTDEHAICMIPRERLPADGVITPALIGDSGCAERPRGGEKYTGMIEDRDGNIWVVSLSGVMRLRHQRLRTIPYRARWTRIAVVRDSAGAVTVVAGEPTSRQTVGATSMQPMHEERGTLLQRAGRNQTVLLAKQDALVVQEPGRQRTIAYPVPGPGPKDRVRRLIQEDADTFWVGWSLHGLWRYANGQWTRPDTSAALVARGGDATDQRGHVWLAYANNTIVERRPDGERRYDARDGVAVRLATFIDAQRELLAAGDGGLQVLSEGRFRTVRAADPEALTGINGLVIAPNEDRWFNTSKGVLHVTARDWADAMRMPAALLRYELLDQLDGFPIGPQLGTIATAASAPDGRMWFAANAGLALYDPRHDRPFTTPPPPQIRAVLANGLRYGAGQPISLAPGTDRVALEFTALNYTIPERTVFRYRLEGIDTDWQGPLAMRYTSYANLGPGQYTFALQAAVQGGTWSTQTARVTFTIRPRFTQTWWFLALCALALALALLLGMRMRVRYLERRAHIEGAARQHERQRIARELHDTVLQTNFALLLQVRAVAAASADNPLAEGLRAIVSQAQATLAEGRDKVAGLRAQQEDDPGFGAAIEQLARHLLEDGNVTLVFTSHGWPWPMGAAVTVECLAIVSEAVINVRQHAHACTLRIDVRYGLLACVIAISDNGCGMAPEHVGGRAGHWGLAGMRERAALIRARLDLDTGAGGTTVRLTVKRCCAGASRRKIRH